MEFGFLFADWLGNPAWMWLALLAIVATLLDLGLAGLWAGQLMGLSGAALTACAVEVHLADFEAPGDGDVVDKIMRDFHRAGLTARAPEVRARLSAFHREALLQAHARD